MFAEAFIESGGIESLLVLLQKEAKAGDDPVLVTKNDKNLSVQGTERDSDCGNLERNKDDEVRSPEESGLREEDSKSEPLNTGTVPVAISTGIKIERMPSISENSFMKNLGGISLSITADNARNNFYNVDKSDAVVVGIIELLGALISCGHLSSQAPSERTSNFAGIGLHDRGGTMFDDKVSLLLFALQKAFQAAPNRLMTGNVYTALLGASV